MRKPFLFAILLSGCIVTSYAQTEPVGPPAKKEKKTDQYIGVQLNGLIRQVFNFNSSSTSPVTNPYLLTYNISSRATHWGFRAGLGYNYNSTWNNDGITERTTKINDVALRVGVEKSFALSDKWSAGVGGDLLLNLNDDNTNTIIHSFDTVYTDTKTKITSYGFGAMGWLRYHITERISIGTEASFYYTTGSQENTVTVTEIFGGSFPNITTTSSKPTVSQANINLPIVFYLAVKF